ncbi:MAG: hypothetical protein ACM33T_14095 [Solirubrobacterales bacterium]
MRLGTLALAVTAAPLLWMMLPPDDVVLDRSCGPGTPRGMLSSTVTGDAFWRAQLAAVVTERDSLLARQGRGSLHEETVVSETETRLSRLAERDARAEDPVERERREARLQHSRLQRIVWLTECEGAIRRRLAD